MNPTSDGYVAEATKPLLVLEKDKDNELVEKCLQQFCSNMRRHIQCFESKSSWILYNSCIWSEIYCDIKLNLEETPIYVNDMFQL